MSNQKSSLGVTKFRLPPDPLRAARSLRRALGACAPSPAHPNLQSYLGSPLPALGVRAEGIAALARRVAHELDAWSKLRSRQLLRELWGGTTFEERALAIAILDRRARAVGSAEWRLMDSWVDSATGWALSDALASGPIAHLVQSDPRKWNETLAWSRSRNPWRRRAALYAQARRVRSGDLAGPFRLIDALRSDPDSWVQRAVGTWLRECWKQDRRRTERYLWHRARTLPPIVITVSTERASLGFRRRLRARARRAYTGVGVRRPSS
ncbi:MAG TPA: DNA alkylation repair protein [Thermoplasmata archaeon]|nr:DNA alkylation repair protein [Thermoplasmata archaeon]